MATGPGKYDKACTVAREATGGKAVVLIVLGGYAGNGFGVQSLGEDLARQWPELLRLVAYDIEASL